MPGSVAGLTGGCLQIGPAITGDVISAGAFLGLAGLGYSAGFDGLLYAAGYAAAYPMIGLLFADRTRNLGRFTFADIVSYRLAQTSVRTFAAVSTLVIAIFYLIAQVVGVSLLDRSRRAVVDRAGFAEQRVHMNGDIGAPEPLGALAAAE